MWFTFSVIALLCWSGSDLFSKIGCQDAKDRYSHLKMVTAVGVVMGLHALYQIVFKGVEMSWHVVLTYLPVSMLYILSMTIGYLGLRYIELSISSPICNSSGAIVAVLTFLTAGISEDLPPVALVAVALVCVGVVGLGFTEANEDEDLRRARQDASNRHYAKSWIAIAIPVVYCLLDALGTFADSRVLEVLDEDSANCAYELTFLFVGALCAVWVLGVKKKAGGPQVHRRDLRDRRPVLLHLRPRGSGARGLLRTHHLQLLHRLGPVEPHLPEGKALLEALSQHRHCDCGHRDPGHTGYIKEYL